MIGAGNAMRHESLGTDGDFELPISRETGKNRVVFRSAIGA
jgi:hypothetical protein